MATSQGGYVNGGFDLLKAPDAPTITSVTKNIGSVSVAFTAPANPGGSAVTGYTVTAINESTGASVGATGSGSPISVSTGGGTFKVRSAATNIYGPGRVSAFNTGNVVFSGAELETWGNNNLGQLGDSTVILRSSPVQVGSLTNWLQVSASTDFSSAVKTDGTMWTWGQNSDGQLGQNDRINRSSPVQVGALTNWYQVSAGGKNFAAIKTDGTLWTWGSNQYGRLGVGDYSERSSPVQVGALTNWYQVSAGRTCVAAIKTDGTLWTWGGNALGELGLNTAGALASRTSPVQVGVLTNWASVSEGNSVTVSVKTDGTLWAWGANGNGQLGQGNITYRSSPVQVGGLTNWAQATNGANFSASIKTDGTIWTWGRNNSGQLGQNNTIDRSSPVQVGALTNWAQVSANFSGTVPNIASVKTDGTLWTWGGNTFGQLGDGTVVTKSSPIQVGALTNWFQASAAPAVLALYGVT
jgi:hypothetical protein